MAGSLSAERLGKPQQQDNSQNHHRNQEPPETPQWAGGFPSLPGTRYPPGHMDCIRSPQSSLSSLLSCRPWSSHPCPCMSTKKGAPGLKRTLQSPQRQQASTGMQQRASHRGRALHLSATHLAVAAGAGLQEELLGGHQLLPPPVLLLGSPELCCLL